MTTLQNIRPLALLLVCFLSFLHPAVAQEYEVEPVTFNSAYGDFGAVRFNDGVVFCSSRSQRRLSSDIDSAQYYTDMYVSKLDVRNHFEDPRIFSEELSGILNEGPATFSADYKTVYYTANIAPEKTKETTDIEIYALGIFKAVYENGKWVKKGGLHFNSRKGDYSVFHPCLAQNDSALYFASNRADSYGGSDLYVSFLRNGKWSEPENLGAAINTEESEIFPYISKKGILYFSTNGRFTDRNRHDMDIYSCTSAGPNEWDIPIAMPSPINSLGSDYAYAEYTNEQFGFVSSDRDGQGDRIYSFSKSAPQFYDCLENNRTVFCYHLEDYKIQSIANMPLVYEWSLGDGTVLRGQGVDHCYDKVGVYQINLNLIDTTTNQVFMNASTTELTIREYEQPYILSNDSVVMNTTMRFFSDDSEIKSFKADKHYWIVDNEFTYQGDTLDYTFTTPGYHTVVCGAVSKPQGGKEQKKCAYKQIFVMEHPTQGFPQIDPDPTVIPVENIVLHSKVEFAEKKQSLLYRIVLAKSTDRLPMNHPTFEKVEAEIVETVDTLGTYTYSVGMGAELDRIYAQYIKLREATGLPLLVEQFNHRDFAKTYVRTGKYIKPGDAEQLNIEFNKLRDIKFEYNSAVILEVSHDNLDYIASMLLLEEDFDVRINAHTCSQGTHDYNQTLSEKRAASVREYFIKKGIPASRLITKGYAETSPIASNETEEGKAQNRRVEFIIIFHTNTTEQ